MSNLYTKEYIQKINDLKNFFEEQNHDSELFFIAFVAWCEDINTDYKNRSNIKMLSEYYSYYMESDWISGLLNPTIRELIDCDYDYEFTNTW